MKKKNIAQSIHIVVIIAVFVFSNFFNSFAFAVSSPSGSGTGLAVGSYNVLGYYHGDGSRFNPARLQQIVTNINDMRVDVIGLQEYRDQRKGNPKALEAELQRLNPAYKMSYQEKGDQLNFVYNSSTVRLIEDRSVKVLDSRSSGCLGGTQWIRIALFQTTASNQEFMVINVHPTSGHSVKACDSDRLNTVRGALGDSVVANYAGPIIIVGDFNARPDTPSKKNYDPGPENHLKASGFANARDIPNANRKQGGNIDHIYYKTSTVGAPSYFEAMECGKLPKGNPKLYTSKYTCASDHPPIKAVFSSLSGSGFGCTSGSSLSESRREQFMAWDVTFYDPTVGACCIASVSSGELIGETNAEKAYNFLVVTPIKTNNNQPLNAAQTAGVVGNLMRESGGDTYDLKPDASNGTHFGIVQWGGARFTALKNFAGQKGVEWTDLKTQLEFIIYELENSESKVIKDTTFQNATLDAAGATTAAERWDKFYERSGGHGMAKRQENAKKAFTDFADTTTDSSATDEDADPNKAENDEDEDSVQTLSLMNDSTDPNTAGCSAPAGEYVFPIKASKADIRKWGGNPGDSEWKSGRYHENVFKGYYAVDIITPEGTPVVAFHGGVVLSVSYGSYGELQIQIKDDTGYTYFYTHLSKSRGPQVKEDTRVEAGTLIGYVGNTHEGWDSVPHLHIDKSKNPGQGLRGTCTASRGYCPIAAENRFMKITVELYNSFQQLPDTSTSISDL